MGVGGCRCPISSSTMHNPSPFVALVYKAAISASELEAIKFQITLHIKCTSPLSRMCSMGGLVGSYGLEESKKWPPALLRAHGSDMYDAS
eukprot:1761647-Ditylum_brightwellii.AAC.1